MTLPRDSSFDDLNSRAQFYTNRTKTVKKAKNYSLYIGLILGWLYLPALHAQQIGIPHDDYLRAAGLDHEGAQVKQYILEGLKEQTPWMPDSYFENNASFFSMVLVLSGITPEIYRQLETEGVDMIHAITADSRPFSEQGLLSDVAVTGTVTAVNSDESFEDGFDVSVEIEVEKFLKGSTPEDRLIIRQRAERRNSDNSTRPEQGSTYLFLLSSGVYGYQTANYQFRETGEALVSAPQHGMENLFVIYRMYPVTDGRLQHSAYGITEAENELHFLHTIIDQKKE